MRRVWEARACRYTMGRTFARRAAKTGGGARRETGRSRLLLLGHPECVLETFEGEVALDFSAEFAHFRGLGVLGIDGESLQGRLDRLGGSLERRARGKVAGI